MHGRLVDPVQFVLVVAWLHLQLNVKDANGPATLADLTTTGVVAPSGQRDAATPAADVTADGFIAAGAEAENATGNVPSAPRDVESLIVSARFVTLRWKEPLQFNGDIMGYSVFYRQEGSERYWR